MKVKFHITTDMEKMVTRKKWREGGKCKMRKGRNVCVIKADNREG